MCNCTQGIFLAAVDISLEHVTSLFIPSFLYCAVEEAELEKFVLDQQVVYIIYVCLFAYALTVNN